MRSENFYEPFVFASFFMTGAVVFIALLVLAALMRTKVEKVSPKILYFYVMSFVSLIFLGDGLAVFFTMLSDLAVTLGQLNSDIKKAFLTCSSLLIVAVPAYLFHWIPTKKGLGFEEDEKIIFSYYKYMVLGLSGIAALIFLGTSFRQVLSAMLRLSNFDWRTFNIVSGYGIVGILMWLYHWYIKKD